MGKKCANQDVHVQVSVPREADEALNNTDIKSYHLVHHFQPASLSISPDSQPGGDEHEACNGGPSSPVIP